MLLLSIVTSIICFSVAVLMFTPTLRAQPFYKPVSFYFLFEGAWNLISFLVLEIWPSANFVKWVHLIGIIIFAGYLLISEFKFINKINKKDRQKKLKLSNRNGDSETDI